MFLFLNWKTVVRFNAGVNSFIIYSEMAVAEVCKREKLENDNLTTHFQIKGMI
jgi:hypothetical protein